ncbi:fibronectin type III domain-containing protein [candidate division WOR-3 bacterium]|uniref:Fibronectin type III domain-containing protein n=1 Tax=candidate division WOR-3 bacterium TaxID=2052148 RepID=A0A937XH79_UNCW3|nr:fibronectin type III domain-containing protein [candidate division WOR-3 bacterium]
MKCLTLTVLTGVAALVVIQGCGVLGGPPSGVTVSAGPGESDSTVLVSWTVPSEGAADKYVIHFRPATDSGYTVVGETTAISYAHNPHGVTGQYKVSAVFGGDSYDAAEMPTTVPVQSEAELFEINADSARCGFGWKRDSGVGGVFAMTESANCASVDFYVSDLLVGTGGPLSIVSPNKADSIDSGAVGIVPSAAWRANGFSNPVLADTVPSYKAPPSATYFIYTTLTSQPCRFGCYTAGDTVKHYAMVKVDSFNLVSGRVWLKTWYQLVPGLRLVHY